MLETTENVNLFLPIIFALFISFSVGRLFNRSLYSSALVSKSVPYLVETVPQFNRNLKAEAVMSRPVTTLPKRATVSSISEALSDTNFNGFPIVDNNKNGDSRLLGIISRHTLMAILRNLNRVPDCMDSPTLLGKHLMEDESPRETSQEDEIPEMSLESARNSQLDTQVDDRERYSRHQSANYEEKIPWTEFTEDFYMSVPEFKTVEHICLQNPDKLIDLRPYMEHRPYTVFQKDGLQKVVNLFRMMNLRHLPVLDERRGAALIGIITRQDLFQFMKV